MPLNNEMPLTEIWSQETDEIEKLVAVKLYCLFFVFWIYADFQMTLIQ